MNTTSKIALAAALCSAIASPSFAGDQDLAALQTSSGRVIGQQIAMPAGAYAFTGHGVVLQRSSAGWQNRTAEMSLNDRLAQGRN